MSADETATQWALQYERKEPSPRMENPGGVITVEMVMDEATARHYAARGLPSSGWDHRVVRRQVTPWERA